MAHHHGFRKKARDKLSKTTRTRGISPVVRAIQEFEEGSKAIIIIDPSIHKGMPHPRFHGKTGEVIGKRGRAFILRISDGDAKKVIITLPEHLRKQKRQEPDVAKLIALYEEALSHLPEENRESTIKKLLNTIANITTNS